MPTANLGDVRLHYEASGEGERLLFIHGLGSSARDWENQVRYFSARYRVVTPDLRGHGRSDKPPGPYSIPLFANDIAELIRTLGLGPTHVVGLSLGGFVASQLAVDHRELMRSLVVVNSAPGLPMDTFRDRLRIKRELFLRRLIVRLFGMRTLGRFLGEKLFPRPEQTDLKCTFVERWAENDGRAYLDALATISRWSVRERLSSISCPTCIVSGEHDFIPMSLKEEYIAGRSNAELAVIPDSGHLTPVDQPERFNPTFRTLG
jgi:pimeloyl-ACP methyl ester carboxylesterase